MGARVGRLLRAVPELMILVKAIVIAFRTVVYTLTLLMIIIYVFAITLVQLSPKTHWFAQKYFSGVPAAMLSLLMSGNLADHAPFFEQASSMNPFVGSVVLMFVFLAPVT